MRYKVLLAVFAAMLTSAVALASPAMATDITLRYCEGPVGPGAYVAATDNVPCQTAISVSNRITSRRCWSGQQCDIRGFVCISYYHGNITRPFSYNHHGICTAPGGRRIEFDLG
jgi:hypothetical protein